MSEVKNEHEDKRTLSEDVFYPGHEPRTESATFRETKRAGKKAGERCAVSGVAEGVEYHHVFVEWAFSDAIDWHAVKDIALGLVTRLPVLDLETDAPTAQLYPVEQSLIYAIIQITRARGFDWAAFDPDQPGTFVDSPQNMLVLHEKFHRAKGHGMHMESLPIWSMQAFPRMPGFVYSPDELKARHASENKQ